MKTSSIIALMCGALFIAVIVVVSRILPDAIYVHDVDTDTEQYIILYDDAVLTSSGAMSVESINENGIVLKYLDPGEKGDNYRRILTTSGDEAVLDRIEYYRVSSWSVFQPALYEKPAEYLKTIFMLR